ncbi:hypothetical protein G4Y73_01365 [Wenzhouxiangella sp. XN201]|uniref:hypothetical protein n=1 Tax=Wenzhouxiangella sp. XN201 TaxID=2710755 RepID=UPI0013C83C9F|nr:hypothetical protein [Wenzhouxiangella sp. XN201]NEZ02795.1 hypothetical protein [Wenzhouxiangella sp. XN201]
MRALLLLAMVIPISAICSDYPSLQDQYEVPERYRIETVNQLDAYFDPLNQFERKVALVFSYMLFEGESSRLMEELGHGSGGVHVIELTLELYRALAQRHDFDDMSDYILRSRDQNAQDDELTRLKRSFMQPVISQVESSEPENMGVAEDVGMLAKDILLAYARDNAFATEEQKESEGEEASERAAQIQDATSADLPQRMSATMNLEKVIRSGSVLTLVMRISSDEEGLMELWDSTGKSRAEMHYEFLSKSRNGVCSEGGVNRAYIRLGGTIAYLYLFSDGSKFLTNTIHSCS